MRPGITASFVFSLAATSLARAFDPTDFHEVGRIEVHSTAPTTPPLTVLTLDPAGSRAVLTGSTLYVLDPISSRLTPFGERVVRPWQDDPRVMTWWNRPPLTADLGGDGRYEMVQGLADGSVVVQDALTGSGLTYPSGPGETVLGYAVDDVDAEPGDEILEWSSGAIHVLGGSSATLNRSLVLPSRYAITWGAAAGEVDGMPGGEVVVAVEDHLEHCNVLLLLDADSGLVVRTLPWRLTRQPILEDLDGDGIDELVAEGSMGEPFVARVDSESVLWSGTFNEDVKTVLPWFGLWPRSIEIASPTHFTLEARDGLTGQSHWPLNNGLTCQYFDYGSDCMLDAACPGPEWRQFGGGPPLTGKVWSYRGFSPFAADIDADGSQDLISFARTNTSSGLALLDAWTGLVRRQDAGWTNDKGLLLGQLDADPALEVVATQFGVTTYDGSTLASQWSRYTGRQVRGAALIDDDVDGRSDVVMSDGYLWIVSGMDGSVLRTTYPAGGYSHGTPVSGDFDGDGDREVAASSPPDRIEVLDGNPLVVVNWVSAPCTPVQAFDVDSDGVDDLICDAGSGREYTAWNLNGLGLLWTLAAPPGSGTVLALRILDVDGDGEAEIVRSTDDGTLEIYNLADRSLAWQDTWPCAGSASSLTTGDVNNDGQADLLAGNETCFIWFGKAQAPSPDLTPPSFGGLSSVSRTACCGQPLLQWEPALGELVAAPRYRVYRGDAPGLSPGPDTFVTETSSCSHVDASAQAGVDSFWLVLAVDAAGNVDANTVVLTAGFPPSDPGAIPVLDSVTDLDDCASTGVVVSFAPMAAPAGLRYDLMVDGTPAARGAVSPVTLPALSSGTHAFVIDVFDPSCGRVAQSNTIYSFDHHSQIRIVQPTVTDPSPCALSGVLVQENLNSPFPCAIRVDLLVDSVTRIVDVELPVIYQPGDTRIHPHVLRYWFDSGSTITSRDSDIKWFADAGSLMDAPRLDVIDLFACESGGIFVAVHHPDGQTSWVDDLWGEAGLYRANFQDGFITLPDADAHELHVVSHHAGCHDAVVVSNTVTIADPASCPSEPVALKVAKSGAPFLLLEWIPQGPPFAAVNCWVGTLASLHGAGVYDHVTSRPGLSFPDAPDPSSGCRATDGVSTSLRVDVSAMHDAYFLLSAVDTGGVEGPRGWDSFGRDVSDPGVDPRGLSCP